MLINELKVVFLDKNKSNVSTPRFARPVRIVILMTQIKDCVRTAMLKRYVGVQSNIPIMD